MSSQHEVIRLAGVVERVTFHNAQNGWSVLKISPFHEPHKLVTVVIHQAEVFAGSSMEFLGNWCHHPKYGEQFRAESAIEKKPASSAAIEKYLGSGLIKGVGPKTASRIVQFFQDKTLEVFEDRISDLLKVPGIAEKKLLDIKNSWQDHKAIREVMLFLQNYGVSTLFAVKIYKTYGNNSIAIVSENPYQLAKDIYGIGFFSADKIALKMGFEENGAARIEAGLRHVLAASREEGHCYLTKDQIIENSTKLLGRVDPEKIQNILSLLLEKKEIKTRSWTDKDESVKVAYYSQSLYFDEAYVASRVNQYVAKKIEVHFKKMEVWVDHYCLKNQIKLSVDQKNAVLGIAGCSFSILTGGPGCGKTTTTKVLVRLLKAMNQKVILAAPTGRAAQRMAEVIGFEAKTIHRLLELDAVKGGFKKREEDPLKADFIVIDECSMLDIQLAACLFKAIPLDAQVLFIGDPDQLPSVGAGCVLYDLLKSPSVPSFYLTQVFRQAKESLIIRYAHEINQGRVPQIDSPIRRPQLWKEKADCIFIDAEEATQEQIHFLRRAKLAIQKTLDSGEEQIIQTGDESTGLMSLRNDELKIEKLFNQEFADQAEIDRPIFLIPEKFKYIDLLNLHQAKNEIDELKSVLQGVHPWSTLLYGFSALDMILRLYTKTIPKYFGQDVEIQVLTPQVRGSLGAINLNRLIQNETNPEREGVKEIKFGDRIFREGDRVIQTKNNYHLNVYNGDIGKIIKIDLEAQQCIIQFSGLTQVVYEREDLVEISLAYGITIHKSQGSEFGAVIIPVSTQHFKMLFRNLIYTGLTRAKKICVFVGSRKALSMAVKQIDHRKRQTALTELVYKNF